MSPVPKGKECFGLARLPATERNCCFGMIRMIGLFVLFSFVRACFAMLLLSSVMVCEPEEIKCNYYYYYYYITNTIAFDSGTW